jgi:hypothetical protein
MIPLLRGLLVAAPIAVSFVGWLLIRRSLRKRANKSADLSKKFLGKVEQAQRDAEMAHALLREERSKISFLEKDLIELQSRGLTGDDRAVLSARTKLQQAKASEAQVSEDVQKAELEVEQFAGEASETNADKEYFERAIDKLRNKKDWTRWAHRDWANSKKANEVLRTKKLRLSGQENILILNDWRPRYDLRLCEIRHGYSNYEDLCQTCKDEREYLFLKKTINNLIDNVRRSSEFYLQ